MDGWDIFAIVLSIAVIVVVGFLIPVLIKLKDLLKTTEESLKVTVESDLRPMLHNVGNITEEVEGITAVAHNFISGRKDKSHDDNEPGMVDKIKGNVKENYIPAAKKYAGAIKTGITTGLQHFRASKHTELVKVNTTQELIKAESNQIDLIKQ